VCGAATLVAEISAPAGVEAATSDPGALSSAPKLWKAGEPKTLETVCRFEPSCCGLESCGAVPSLQALMTSAAAATAHHVRRYADMLHPPVVAGEVSSGAVRDAQPTGEGRLRL